MSISTGIIFHGGTIPLPDGYSEDECFWFVSPAIHRVDDDDVIRCYTGAHAADNGAYNSGGWQSDAYVPSQVGKGRVVTCWTSQRGGGYANYIIIGVKN